MTPVWESPQHSVPGTALCQLVRLKTVLKVGTESPSPASLLPVFCLVFFFFRVRGRVGECWLSPLVSSTASWMLNQLFFCFLGGLTRNSRLLLSLVRPRTTSTVSNLVWPLHSGNSLDCKGSEPSKGSYKEKKGRISLGCSEGGVPDERC